VRRIARSRRRRSLRADALQPGNDIMSPRTLRGRTRPDEKGVQAATGHLVKLLRARNRRALAWPRSTRKRAKDAVLVRLM
jgi:hypothetical protein